MFTHRTQIRVRYCETDAMGFAHHSNYVNYYELARADMLRSFGTTYRDMETGGVMMPVLKVNMEFFHPAVYDDLLTIETSVEVVSGATVRFSSVIHNQQGQLVNKGDVTLAFMNSTTRKACRMPQTFKDIMEKIGN